MNGNTQLIPSEQYELTGCTMRQDPRALGKQVLLLQFTLTCFALSLCLLGTDGYVRIVSSLLSITLSMPLESKHLQ